jgi:hypothetical protein
LSSWPATTKPGGWRTYLEVSIEERRLDVHVVHRPLLLESERQQQADRFNPRHGSEDLLEVHPQLLNVPLGDKPGFVLHHLAGTVLLDLEHPL